MTRLIVLQVLWIPVALFLALALGSTLPDGLAQATAVRLALAMTLIVWLCLPVLLDVVDDDRRATEVQISPSRRNSA